GLALVRVVERRAGEVAWISVCLRHRVPLRVRRARADGEREHLSHLDAVRVGEAVETRERPDQRVRGPGHAFALQMPGDLSEGLSGLDPPLPGVRTWWTRDVGRTGSDGGDCHGAHLEGQWAWCRAGA